MKKEIQGIERPLRKTTDQFIAQSRKKYGDQFIYDKTVYGGDKVVLTMTCKDHGDFQTTPNNHLCATKTGGCPECGRIAAYSDNLKRVEKARDTFIERSKSIFLETLSYDKLDYKTNHTPVILTCKIHGDFEVTPNKHLYRGKSCPLCESTSHNERILEIHTDNILIREVKLKVAWDRKQTQDDIRLHRVRYDFYCPHLRMLIEVNGEQHYKPSWTAEKLQKQIEIDRFKINQAINRGFNFCILKMPNFQNIIQFADILKRSTTIEMFKENIKSFDKVEYTDLVRKGGNGEYIIEKL